MDKKDLKRFLSNSSEFTRKVYKATLSIPQGEVRTYQWIATRAGNPKAYRAVGSILAKNPFPLVIPCHRVIRKDGGIGGYSGGISLKRRLLKKEHRLSQKKIRSHR